MPPKDWPGRIETLRRLSELGDGGAPQAHTVLADGVVSFRPSELLHHRNADAHAQAAHVLLGAAALEEVRVRVDCGELTATNARALFRRSSWRDIRTGVDVFAAMPAPVRAITVLEPAAAFAEWWWCKTLLRRWVSTKMRARLEWQPSCCGGTRSE